MSEPNAALKKKRPDLAVRNRSRHPHPIFPLGEEAEIKHCTVCCQDKPFGEFYLDSKNDSDGRRSNCAECQKAASIASYYRLDREKLNARVRLATTTRMARVNALKDVPCADCGGRFPAYCMDFDHVRGVKVMAVSRMIRQAVAWEKVLAEVAKCEVVCANCHRIRTQERRQQYGNPAGSNEAAGVCRGRRASAEGGGGLMRADKDRSIAERRVIA